MADTSQSSASAIRLSLVGGSVVDSGTRTASNDGTTETFTGNASPALTVLGTQSVITAGVLGQDARAFTDGTTAACAGAVGSGGSIVVGASGSCTVTNGSSLNLTLGNIAGVGTISLVADAIYATCTATSAPSTTGGTTLANARIVATLAGIPTTLATLAANPAKNTTLSVGTVLTVSENTQTNPSTGEIHVTALDLTAIAPTLASLQIGRVVCGPDAQSAPVPSIPLKGAPIALGVAGLFAGGVMAYRRFRLGAV